jgi:hypothetical protein
MVSFEKFLEELVTKQSYDAEPGVHPWEIEDDEITCPGRYSIWLYDPDSLKVLKRAYEICCEIKICISRCPIREAKVGC